MLERLTGQLPIWAHRDHPLIRYELNGSQYLTRRRLYFRAAGIVAAVVLLFGVGYLVATNFSQSSLDQSLTASSNAIVYWPMVTIQIIMQIAALVLTVNMVSEQKRRQAWDNLRATEGGVALALRARWASVFYRLRGFLALVVFVRVLLILGILYDLTAFQGRYIDLLLNGITPETLPLIGALFLAILMTAGLLLPATSIGMDAAVGLLISVIIQSRLYSVLTQVVLIALRVTVVAGLLIAATQFIRGELVAADPMAWGLMAGFAAFGDWGLAFLHLGFYSDIWTTIPFGVWLGVALLIFCLVQAAFTEWVLGLAVRLAERNG